jgi:cytochrome c553
MHNAIDLAILVAIAAMLIWSAIRALRIRNKLVKWGSVGLATAWAVAAVLLSGLAIAGQLKLQSRSAPIPQVNVAGTAEQVQRGRAIANSFCEACHAGELSGGLDIGEHFPISVGSFTSANLTPAGRISRWSDGEIFRAIRNSIDADGRWMIIMSYTNAGKLSDEDIEALIAYLRSRPATGRRTNDPPDQLNLLGMLLLGAGMLPGPRPVAVDVIAAPPKGPTARYGEYILSYQDCRACHGADLTGGVQGQIGPIGPGLAMVRDWKLEEFVSTLRTGIDPSGHRLGKEMPWQVIARMDDDELTAIYEYLVRLPDPQSSAAR